MSVELPEVNILTGQMQKALVGKQIVSVELKDCDRLQKIGFINKDASAFDRLIGGCVETVVSRGNVIRTKLDNGLNLLLSPEYGGKITYHPAEAAVPAKFHLKLGFSDGTALTVTLTGMGVIQALKDDELDGSYVYRRDFSKTPSPLEAGFTFEDFAEGLAGMNVNIKSAIVGKDALVVGFGNSSFQDIIYRAGIHPKRKAADLSDEEKRALFDAVNFVVKERIRLGGKTQFQDLYGKQGAYVPAMGPNMKNQPCTNCGATVERLSLGGGQVYFCKNCQK